MKLCKKKKVEMQQPGDSSFIKISEIIGGVCDLL